MIDKKKYYNNLEFVSALFYADLLNEDDISDISNYLLNNGYDDTHLIDIWLSRKNDKTKILSNFNSFLREKGLAISSKEKAINILINLVFNEILGDKIPFMDGIEFITQYLVDNSKNEEFVGDYLGLEKIIGIYYAVDDGDITDKNEIKKALNLGIEIIREYEKTNTSC